jgi:DNA-binding MarR family transcriptional regulator
MVSATSKPKRRAPAGSGKRSATPPVEPARPKALRRLDQSPLQTLVGYHLRRAEVHTRQLVIRALSDWDIRPPEYSALALIASNNLVTQADLGEALNIKRPNMVSLIEKLERRGLVNREVHARDRRNHILTATEKGHALLTDIDGILHEIDRAATACWTAGEKKQMVELLQRLYRGPLE